MHRNFTLENLYSFNLQKAQDKIEPAEQTIKNLLAYSKALSTINCSNDKSKNQIYFQIVLN